MTVEPCPDECEFDWPEFHNRLDTALAHMIMEKDARPTKTTILEFLEYSNAKSKAQVENE
jgi:hypothetical protein